MPAYTQFISRATDFQVVLEHQGLPLLNDRNIVVGQTRGKMVKFTRGSLTADDKTARLYGYSKPSELADALRNSGTFNAEFWELGNEPGALHPPTDKLLADIADAAVRRNQKRLRQIIEEEEASHKREAVLTSARAALGAMGDTDYGRRRPGRPHDVKPEDEQETPEAA